MKRTKTKILSVFLSVCMIISCMVGMSVTASAAGGTEVTKANVICQQYSYSDASSYSGGTFYDTPPVEITNITLADAQAFGAAVTCPTNYWVVVYATDGDNLKWTSNGKTGEQTSTSSSGSGRVFSAWCQLHEGDVFRVGGNCNPNEDVTFYFSKGLVTEWDSGDCHVKLDGSTMTVTKKDGAGDGKMKDYTDSGENTVPWESVRNNVKSVVISNGVTSVGAYAFKNFEKVTSLSIADTVTSIGKCAFRSCDYLLDITIPASVTSIGDNAFLSYSADKTVKFVRPTAESTLVVGEDAFHYSSSLNYSGDGKYGLFYEENEVELTGARGDILNKKTLNWKAVGPVYTPVPAKAATCTTAGNKEYYTSEGKYYIKNGEEYVETTLEDVTIAALGHSYKKTVISEPTCTEAGEYEFTCTRCDSHYTSKPKAKGHKWGTPTYEWADDLSACTATVVCKNDETHTETETVAVTSAVTKEATCTDKGVLTYTAEFTNEHFSTQTKTEAIAALGHDWDSNGVCKRCGFTPQKGPSGTTPSGGSTSAASTVTPTVGSFADVTSENTNYAGAEINMKTDELEIAVLTDEDRKVIEAGGDVSIELLVEKMNPTEEVKRAVEAAVEAAKEASGKDYNVVMYFDANLFKTSNGTTTQVHETNGKVAVSITLPEQLKRPESSVRVLHIHNDTIKILNCIVDRKTNQVTFETDSFSVYALMYEDAPAVGIKAVIDGSSVKLKWTSVTGADSYNVYSSRNGKWVKLITTKNTALNVVKLGNNKTYKYMVRANVDGKLVSKDDAYKVTVNVCYKPVLETSLKNGKLTLTWSEVNNAEKYGVCKYTDGEWKLVKTTEKLTYRIKTTSGKTYKYAVKALVDGKWTSIGTASKATVNVK